MPCHGPKLLSFKKYIKTNRLFRSRTPANAISQNLIIYIESQSSEIASSGLNELGSKLQSTNEALLEPRDEVRSETTIPKISNSSLHIFTTGYQKRTA